MGGAPTFCPQYFLRGKIRDDRVEHRKTFRTAPNALARAIAASNSCRQTSTTRGGRRGGDAERIVSSRTGPRSSANGRPARDARPNVQIIRGIKRLPI
jgi:hypothetical protein